MINKAKPKISYSAAENNRVIAERDIYILEVNLIIGFLAYGISSLSAINRTKYGEPVLDLKVILKIAIYVTLSFLN